MTTDQLDALLHQAQTRAGLMDGDDFPARVVEAITELRSENEAMIEVRDMLGNKWAASEDRAIAADAQVAAANADSDRLAEALSALQSYGCPACRGDCSSANPPVSRCPMRETESALAAHNARKEGKG